MNILLSRILIATSATALLGLTAACGGDDGSGVDSGKKITDLTPAEAVSVCEYTEGLYPTEEVQCGEITFEPNPADCSNAGEDLPPPSCGLTVGQYEQCIEDVTADICAAGMPPSCAPLFAEGCD